MAEFKYRPDIDGLRAVAVSLVLLFHAGLGFSGGFVGVDVFFVISGYLITGLILKEQDAGKFSLADFWGRRVRRIMPAATVMVLAVIAAGYFLLLPSDYEDLAKSAVCQQAMISNFYFWRTTGYFDGPTELKPLVHTWSLAVEEQFYIAYPFLLMLLHRWGRRTTFVVLLLGALASLALSIYGVSSFPSATFYLLPTRAWEMMMGGLVCFLPSIGHVKPWKLSVAGWISIVAILYVGWCYSEATPFPGLAAVIPCAATASLIYANSDSPLGPAKLLACKPVIFIGLISYSLYLWHWPILAIYRYWLGSELSVLEAAILLSATFVAAVISWRFVESPLRRGGAKSKRRYVLATAAISTVSVVILAAGIAANRGLEWRVPPEVVQLQMVSHSKQFIHEVTEEQVASGRLPRLGAKSGVKKCLLWGDSHAMAVAPGLDEACKQLGCQGFQATHSSTPPVLELVFPKHQRHGNKKSPLFNRKVVEFVRSEGIDCVFLVGVWSSYAKLSEFEQKLRLTISEVNSAGATVFVVLDIANQGVDVPSENAKRAFWKMPLHQGVPVEKHRARNRSAEAIIRRVCAESRDAQIVDPAKCFVDSNNIWRAEIEGKWLYRNAGHLSVEGGERLAGVFAEVLQKWGN